jgi:hypothetical protein
LGQPDGGRMRLRSLHPGVPLSRVQAKTGFQLIVPPSVPETEPPSPAELRLLREQIDPLGVRQLETLSGAARRDRLRAILQAEREAMTSFNST